MYTKNIRSKIFISFRKTWREQCDDLLIHRHDICAKGGRASSSSLLLILLMLMLMLMLLLLLHSMRLRRGARGGTGRQGCCEEGGINSSKEKRIKVLTLSVLPHALQEVQTARDDDHVAQMKIQVHKQNTMEAAARKNGAEMQLKVNER